MIFISSCLFRQSLNSQGPCYMQKQIKQAGNESFSSLYSPEHSCFTLSILHKHQWLREFVSSQQENLFPAVLTQIVEGRIPR